MEKGRILIVEDDPSYVKLYRNALGTSGYAIEVAREPSAGLRALRERTPDLVLLDLTFDGTPQGGLGFISGALQDRTDLSIIIISAQSDSAMINKAIELGAVDYIVKDHSLYELLPFRINQALKRMRLEKLIQTQIDLHNGFVFGPGRVIVGKSPKMYQVYALIEKVAWSRSTVLILGESGTGKELVAQAIHARKGPDTPFISIDCGSVPETVLESELFGVKARYPGFHNREPLIGKMEAAKEGTFLLDEIGNMSIGLQAKLLRVMEERKFRPLGGEELPLRAQVISSTNIDFKTAIQSGRFREDLYYRLNEVRIVLPPLRDRLEDVPLLARHLLDQLRSQTGRAVEILPQALDKLMAYDWPGNVRELAKTLQRALMACQSQYLAPKHIDLSLTGGKTQQPEAAGDTTKDDAESFHPVTVGNYKKMVREYRKALLRSALELADGNQSEAARLLGLNRTHLIRLLGRHDLTKSGEMG